MKISTLLNKLFGKDSIGDYMEMLDESDKEVIIEYWTVDTEEDACEPSYFVRVYTNGTFKVSDINNKVLKESTSEKEFKSFLKVLATKDSQ